MILTLKKSKIKKIEDKKYKYEVEDDFIFILPLKGFEFSNPYLILKKNGEMTIKKGYRYDGATGGIDTGSFRIPSLVHDGLYQILRESNFEKKEREYFRKESDIILKELCKINEMGFIRRNYVYIAVRLFGGSFSKKEKKEELK